MGVIVRFIGWKKVKFLFWLLMGFFALRGTVLFLIEWVGACDFQRAIDRFDGFAMWLIPCSVFLLGYIRCVFKGNRDKRVWIVLPMMAMIVLCSMVGIGVKVRCVAQENYQILQERRAYRQCSEQELMAGKTTCWADEPVPPLTEEMRKRIEELHAQAKAQADAEAEKRKQACSTAIAWAESKGVRREVDAGSNVQLFVNSWFEGLGDADKISVVRSLLCDQNMVDWSIDNGPQRIAICDAETNQEIGNPYFTRESGFSLGMILPDLMTASRPCNLLNNSNVHIHWGMSIEQVEQIEAEQPIGPLKPDEVGTDYLIYRMDSHHFTGRICYYFTNGKLAEISQDIQKGDDYNVALQDLTKSLGQPVNLDVPGKWATFVSPTDVVDLASRGQGGYSVIRLDRSQPNLVAR